MIFLEALEVLDYLEHALNDVDFRYDGGEQDETMIRKGYVTLNSGNFITITDKGFKMYKILALKRQNILDRISRNNSLGGF